MAPPAAPAPRPGQPVAAAREPRPIAAPRRPATPPPAWLRHASTGALGLLVAVYLWSAWREARVISERRHLSALERAQMQSEQITRAWTELAAQGSLLHARLANAGADLAAARAAIEGAAKAAGVTARIGAPVRIKVKSGHKASRLAVDGVGPETKVLDFLMRIDVVPALVTIDKLTLRGVEVGRVTYHLDLVHDELKTRAKNQLEAFVRDLPQPPRVEPAGTAGLRSAALFFPQVKSAEELIASWPRIVLAGFTGDQGFFQIGADTRSLPIGALITGDIFYLNKLGVNQALLLRKSDGAKVIVTIGVPSYTLPKSESDLRSGFSEFSMSFPRSAANDLATAAAAALP